jgi:hypothetical protein
MKKLLVLVLAVLALTCLVAADTSVSVSKNVTATKIKLHTVTLNYIDEEIVATGVLLDSNGSTVKAVHASAPFGKAFSADTVGAAALTALKKQEGL